MIENPHVYVDRYRQGEWRDRIFLDMVLDDARTSRPRPTILDIGCGGGFDGDVPLQRRLAAAAGQYVGVEPDPAIPLGDYFHQTHRCRFEDAPLEPGSVDLAVAVMVLEHLPRPAPFWDKLHAVLADGGVFWALTVDGRHPFCRLSLLAERLRLKDLYLNTLLGRRGVERYENYPVHYRTNTPRQIAAYTKRFREVDTLNLARVGQWGSYLPRPLRRLAEAWDRRAIRANRPGTLLAVRAVK